MNKNDRFTTSSWNSKKKSSSDKVPVLNNDVLIQQICTSIISDHHDNLLSDLENGKRLIEYHVRDGQLQKRKHIEVSDLLDTDETFYAAMSREHLKCFIMLIETKLKRKSALDYGAIQIGFEITPSGIFQVRELNITRENHFARY